MPANHAPALSVTVTAAKKCNVVYRSGTVLLAANTEHVGTRNYSASPRSGALDGRSPYISSPCHRSASSFPSSPLLDDPRSRLPFQVEPARKNLKPGISPPTAREHHAVHYAALFAAITDPESNYRQLPSLPIVRPEKSLRKVVLSPTETTTKKERQSVGSKRVNRQLMKKAYVFAPFKRYPTTYVDTWRPPNTTPRGRGMGSLYHTPRSPERLPGRRKSFDFVPSRFMDHLPPSVKLPSDQKFINRDTKLCYTKQKHPRPQRAQLHVAQQVRKMDTEYRRLMHLQRVREVGDRRGVVAYEQGLRLRRQAREEAYQAIRHASNYLKELDKCPDPMDTEREQAYRQIEVAQRRLAIADQMDEIDMQIELGKREAERFPLPRPYPESGNVKYSPLTTPRDKHGAEKRLDVLPYERRRTFLKAEQLGKEEPIKKMTQRILAKGRKDAGDGDWLDMDDDVLEHHDAGLTTAPGRKARATSQVSHGDVVSRGSTDSDESKDSNAPSTQSPASPKDKMYMRKKPEPSTALVGNVMQQQLPQRKATEGKQAVATKDNMYGQGKSKPLTSDVSNVYKQELAERRPANGDNIYGQGKSESLTADVSNVYKQDLAERNSATRSNIYGRGKSKPLTADVSNVFKQELAERKPADGDNIYGQGKSESLTADVGNVYQQDLAERNSAMENNIYGQGKSKQDLAERNSATRSNIYGRGKSKPLTSDVSNVYKQELAERKPANGDNIYGQGKSESLTADVGNVYKQDLAERNSATGSSIYGRGKSKQDLAERNSATRNNIYGQGKSKPLTADVSNKYKQGLADRKSVTGNNPYGPAKSKPLTSDVSNVYKQDLAERKPTTSDNIYRLGKSESLTTDAGNVFKQDLAQREAATMDNVYGLGKSKPLTADVGNAYKQQLPERKEAERKPAATTKDNIRKHKRSESFLSAKEDDIYQAGKPESLLPASKKADGSVKAGAAYGKSQESVPRDDNEGTKNGAESDTDSPSGTSRGEIGKRGSRERTPATSPSASNSFESNASSVFESSSSSSFGSSSRSLSSLGHTDQSGYSSCGDTSQSGYSTTGGTSRNSYSSSGSTNQSGYSTTRDTGQSSYSGSVDTSKSSYFGNGDTGRSNDFGSGDAGSSEIDSGPDSSMDQRGTDGISGFEETASSRSSFEDSDYSSGSRRSSGLDDSFSDSCSGYSASE